MLVAIVTECSCIGAVMRHFHGKHVRSRDPPPPSVVLLALYCQVRCNERDGGEEADK